jgi:hypothetical protein
VAACPENAIGLDYQIDLAQMQSHRACVKACRWLAPSISARSPAQQSERFDLVLDLRAATPRPPFAARAAAGLLPLGRAGLATVLKLRELVGEFEKPKFFRLQAEALRPQPQRKNRLQRLRGHLLGRSDLQ